MVDKDSLGRGDLPLLTAEALPWITVAQMREVDRLMIEEIGISLEQMMENAGRALASPALDMLGGATGRHVVVLAGPGGNGGGGMAAARHLALAGAQVEVMLGVPPGRLAGTPRRQFEILEALGLPVATGPPPTSDGELVIDALLGYSQDGPPRGEVAELVRWSAGRRVLALDVPTGLELSTGRLHEPHAVAEQTVTLALPKQGLCAPGAAEAVGRLLLADISVPPLVYERLRLSYRTPFGRGPLVEIQGGGVSSRAS